MQRLRFSAPQWTTRMRAYAPGRRVRGFTLIELLVALGLMALMAALSWRGLDAMQRNQTRLARHSQEVLSLQNGLAQWTADLEAIESQPGQSSMDWDGRALRLLRRGSQSAGEGLYVVAWAQGQRAQGSVWLRWSSPPLTSRAQLQAAWSQAALWAQNPGDAERLREAVIAPLSSWQIVYFRGGAWSNPLSSADQVSASASITPAVPATAASGAISEAPKQDGAVDAGKGLLGAVAGNLAGNLPGTVAAPNEVQAKTEALPDGVRLVLTLPDGGAISGTLTRDWSRAGLGGS
jgi:general secretion pathway protein J